MLFHLVNNTISGVFVGSWFTGPDWVQLSWLLAGLWSFLAVGLLYARLPRIPPRARPLLYLLTGLFVIGALLATATNQRVDFQILAWHATWHIVGAFGFIVLWAFNHMRFVMSET
jgi:hypothetical protein